MTTKTHITLTIPRRELRIGDILIADDAVVIAIDERGRTATVARGFAQRTISLDSKTKAIARARA